MTVIHRTTATALAALAGLGALLIAASASTAQPAPDPPYPGPASTPRPAHSGHRAQRLAVVDIRTRRGGGRRCDAPDRLAG